MPKLLKRYTKLKEKFLRNSKDLRKISSILKREEGKAISFEKYKEICKENIYGWENEIMAFDFPWDFDIIKELTNYSVDQLYSLIINLKVKCENDHERMEKFLLSFKTTEIKEFEFNGYSNIAVKDWSSINNKLSVSYLNKVYSCSNFFDGLRNAMSLTTDTIAIRNLEVSSREFCKLIRAAKSTKKIYFSNCRIFTNHKYTFKEMEGCQIEKLGVGYDDNLLPYDSLSEYEDSLIMIFKAILHCFNLMKSLKRIIFTCSDVMKSKMHSIALEVHGVNYEEIIPFIEIE